MDDMGFIDDLLNARRINKERNNRLEEIGRRREAIMKKYDEPAFIRNKDGRSGTAVGRPFHIGGKWWVPVWWSVPEVEERPSIVEISEIVGE